MIPASPVKRKCVCGHADWRHRSEIGDLTYCRSCDCDRWQDSAPAEAPNGQGGDATDEITQLRAQVARVTKERDEEIEQHDVDIQALIDGQNRQLYILRQENAELRADRERVVNNLRRYSNPHTVQVMKRNKGRWLDFAHDAPLTLQEAEKRCEEHQSEQPQASFRVFPWFTAAQRQVINELREDKERLDWMINQSNNADHPWLDESVWDDLPGASDDVLKEVRVAIDVARATAKQDSDA